MKTVLAVFVGAVLLSGCKKKPALKCEKISDLVVSQNGKLALVPGYEVRVCEDSVFRLFATPTE